MAQHAGLLGRRKPFYPEHDVKLLTLKMSDPPPIIKTHTKEKENKTWQETGNPSQ
jgi:hypothetical protein